MQLFSKWNYYFCQLDDEYIYLTHLRVFFFARQFNATFDTGMNLKLTYEINFVVNISASSYV